MTNGLSIFVASDFLVTETKRGFDAQSEFHRRFFIFCILIVDRFTASVPTPDKTTTMPTGAPNFGRNATIPNDALRPTKG